MDRILLIALCFSIVSFGFGQHHLTLLDNQSPDHALVELGFIKHSLEEAMSWDPKNQTSSLPSSTLITGEPGVEATPLSGCINSGDPECNGVCESGDSPTGPDCNGTCGSGDSSSGPDCNGVCGSGDSSSGPDCNGTCGAGDSSSGPDCNGACGSGDSSSGPDCNGVCGASDSSSGPDCNGACGSGDSSSGPDCNGVCGASDSSSGPDCNGACGSGDSSSGPDCNGLCDPGDSSSGSDCNGRCDLGEQAASVDCDGFCNAGFDDPFSVDCTPLPAELISFDALVEGCSVMVQWETASELNVSHFILERKVQNGYHIVGQLPAKGSSNSSATYKFLDLSPERENLYRLATHDFDGSIEFSDLISARLDCEVNSIRLSPNPVRNQLSISGIVANFEEVAIRVFSMSTGTLVLPPIENDGESVRLNFQNLPAGVYMLQVDQDGQFSNHRFIKQ